MKKLLMILSVGIALAGCQTKDQTTLASTAAGAAIGAAIDDDNALRGAAIGGAVGLAAGTLLGRSANNPEQCVYQDRFGQRYVADC